MDDRPTARDHSSRVAYCSRSQEERTAAVSSESKKARRTRKPRVTSWFSFVPHPERYIIHRKFGFTQLIRE